MEKMEHLPVHPVPGHIQRLAGVGQLKVTGLVQKPYSLTGVELSLMLRYEKQEDFSCLEGWMVPSLVWSGFKLFDVINHAFPLESAKFVNVIASDENYSVPISLEDVNSFFLCDRMNGSSLPIEHGAPWRLISAGGSCYSSVKWIKELELTENEGLNNGKKIALSRINIYKEN